MLKDEDKVVWAYSKPSLLFEMYMPHVIVYAVTVTTIMAFSEMTVKKNIMRRKNVIEIHVTWEGGADRERDIISGSIFFEWADNSMFVEAIIQVLSREKKDDDDGGDERKSHEERLVLYKDVQYKTLAFTSTTALNYSVLPFLSREFVRRSSSYN